MFTMLRQGRGSKGFAVPLVVMGGLTVTVLAATIILSSMNQKLTVESRSQSDNSMALAEAGVARGMSLLVRGASGIGSCYLPVGSEVDLDSKEVPGGTSVRFSILSDEVAEVDSTGRFKSSSSRVKVQFPYVDSESVEKDCIPGLWAEGVKGKGRIHADVLSESDLTGLDLFRVPESGPLSLPNGNQDPPLTVNSGEFLGSLPLPTLPEFTIPGEATELTCPPKGKAGAGITKDGPYTFSGDCEVNLSPGVRASIFVDGDTTVKGSKVTGSGLATVTWHINGDLELYGGSELGADRTTILVYGERKIDLRGNSDIYGLLVAPESSVRMNGTTKIGGGVWAEEVDTGNSGQGKVYQWLTSDQINAVSNLLTKGSLPMEKRVGSISSFRTVEVGDP